MRKLVTILGTLLIAAVLIISGSAVAAWVFADHYEPLYTDCTNPNYAVGTDNGNYASLGDYGPPAELGYITLDLGPGNMMPNSQDFTVFAETASNETYDVYVGEVANPAAAQYVGTGWDTEDLTFQTPSTGKGEWRYIYLEGATGTLVDDPSTGPDIDAVGWDKP